MSVSRLFKTDMFNDPVEPDKMYEVCVWRKNGSTHLTRELVSGEELLAVAEWIDQQQQHIEKDADNE